MHLQNDGNAPDEAPPSSQPDSHLSYAFKHWIGPPSMCISDCSVIEVDGAVKFRGMKTTWKIKALHLKPRVQEYTIADHFGKSDSP